MQVELMQDWRGYRVGSRFELDVIGGGVFDVLQRNNVARLLPGPGDAGEGSRNPPYGSSGDSSDDRASDDRRGQGTAQHRGKRR